MGVILDPVGAGGQMELLWSNPAPGSDFSPQTVNLDLSAYALVLVTSAINASMAATINGYHVNACKVGKTGILDPVYDYMARRYFTVSKTGVTFQGGTQVALYNGSTSNSNTYAIPIEIYGVRM